MRTHPDIGLVIADLLQLARFWLCNKKSEIHKKSLFFLRFLYLSIHSAAERRLRLSATLAIPTRSEAHFDWSTKRLWWTSQYRESAGPGWKQRRHREFPATNQELQHRPWLCQVRSAWRHTHAQIHPWWRHVFEDRSWAHRYGGIKPVNW